MTIRLLSLALIAALAWPTSVVAQEFVSVPSSFSVTDITPDGSVVVGYGTGGGYYWRWQSDPAPTFIGGNIAAAVSDDGLVIVGSITDPVINADVAARWTQATGWVSLGWLPGALSCPSRSNACDVSGDGSTVVGLSWAACNGRGFRWTAATGMQELMPVGDPTDLRNRASAISGDGSAIGGFAQGTYSRAPAYWSADTSGFIVDMNAQGEVQGFNGNGSLSVGTAGFPGDSFLGAFARTASGVVTKIGALDPANMAGTAQDISEDASTIVGYDYIGLSREAWVWRSNSGIISLNDRLSALGVNNVPPIYTCLAASDDGNIVVGTHGGPGIFSAGYIAALGPTPWVNIGGGAPGVDGVPHLAGTGSLVGGTPAGLKLEHAPLFTLALAWVSFAPTPLAAFGGTIHTHPYNKQFVFLTNNGEVNINTTWPTGLPQGTEAFFQFLISDSSVFHEITLSNALKATTP